MLKLYLGKFHPWTKPTVFFGKYVGVQEQNNVHKILKFGILSVPLKQIPTKKGWNLNFAVEQI
jgi:hypothetical protein